MTRDEIVEAMAEEMRNLVKHKGIVAKYDDYATAALHALDQADLQIVVGEPVAWMDPVWPTGAYTKATPPVSAYMVKGWTPLFAGKVQT